MEAYVSWGRLFVAMIVAIALWWLSSRQLVTETKKLHRFNEMILKALQNNDMADLRYNDKGEIVGLNIAVGIQGSTTMAEIIAVGIQGSTTMAEIEGKGTAQSRPNDHTNTTP